MEPKAMLMLITLAVSQSVAGPPAPAPKPVTLKPVETKPCPRDARGDIVVCGSTNANEQYRLRPLPERFQDSKRVVVKLPGNATLAPEIQQGKTFGEGQIAIGLKIPF